MANINFVVKNDIELKGNLIFEGTTPNSFETTLAITDPTSDRTITFPNSTGTVALTSDLSSYLTTSSASSTYAPIASPTLTGTTTVTNIKATSTYSGGSPTAQITEYAHTPTGIVNPFAGSSAPAGWLLCSGQTVSRTTYAALFAVIGTTYGAGDGSTTFSLPDLRGRTLAGIDNMGGTDAGRLDIANSSGTVTGTQYVSTSNHAHNHFSPVGLNSGTNMLINPSSGLMDGLGSYDFYDIQTGSGHYASAGTVTYERWYVTSSQNGAQTLNNMQPTMVMNYIIKY